jgi:hypothetical protein
MRTPKNCGNHAAYTRRHFLLGAASVTGFRLLNSHADAQVISSGVTPRNSARTCIFINLDGGPSHLDTFAPKDGPWNPPDADLQQSSGGIVLAGKWFPAISKIAGDLCILKSVQSWEAAHTRAQFYLQTSHSQNPAFATETPHIGAVVSRELGDTAQALPPFLALHAARIQGQAFLGGRQAPMFVTPSRNGLADLGHDYYGASSREVFERKFALLEALNAPLRANPFDSQMADYGDFYSSANRMMYDESVANIFRFNADDEGRYGQSDVGRSLILARNAVRADNGARFISVLSQGWDTHQAQFDPNNVRTNFTLTASALDRAVGALVEDLRSSGHLDKTLIVMMGEFGRTPGDLNAMGGRDHYKEAMAGVMIGGGVRGGRVIGEQDSTGAQIVTPGWRGDRPIQIEDITATIYSALGIDWTKSIADTPSGRTFEYVPYASTAAYFPVDEVFALP